MRKVCSVLYSWILPTPHRLFKNVNFFICGLSHAELMLRHREEIS